ncbi:MAG: MFS transporter [Bdellovibrionales bacterium CG10_big_fil_rev_8_21_14_0_10_45_34]|nr:MAG: MFS transporter [Bdellovibrionales bacterium CG10_big_fil_rev_8_21_14_0_10_45_34]
MIEIRGLTKRYGNTTAVDSLEFTVNKGEVVGFLGPNGAGKSTTMKIITGYMAPTTGDVKIAGLDVFENPIEVKRKIGFLPEHPPLYQDMFVTDYLKFVAKLKGVPKTKLKSQVEMAIEKTNLQDVAKRLIQNLSKGFKQRVGVAQALVSDPEILILDEPTVGLDPKQVAEMRKLIQSLKGHHTIVLSTHILPEVQATCQRIIIINKGKIVAKNTLDELNNRMAGHQKYRLKVRDNVGGLKDKLAALKGVEGVDLVDGVRTFEVQISGGVESVDELSRVAVEARAGLLELTPQTESLEDIFLKLTSKETSV